MESKKALIFGVTGQDGSYLAEFLLSKGYEVHGVIRRSSSFNTGRLEHFMALDEQHTPGAKFFGHYGDMTDSTVLISLIQKIQPDEIYNLAAQSHVKVSFEIPEYTANTDGLGTLRVLEAIRLLGLEKKTKFYQASTSEMFGKVQETPQSETTPFYPRSPYGAAKLYGYWITKNYREAYNIFGVNGILFNHESFRRGGTFVTKKVTHSIAKILRGTEQKIYLGNLYSKRDWGFAPEYVESMWKMLQHDTPEDFVIGTGETHSIEELVKEAFAYVGLNWQEFVEIDKIYLRPTEIDLLVANPKKAKEKLGWEPRITFKDLVRIMVDADLRALGLTPPGGGDGILDEKFPNRWWKAD